MLTTAILTALLTVAWVPGASGRKVAGLTVRPPTNIGKLVDGTCEPHAAVSLSASGKQMWIEHSQPEEPGKVALQCTINGKKGQWETTVEFDWLLNPPPTPIQPGVSISKHIVSGEDGRRYQVTTTVEVVLDPD